MTSPNFALLQQLQTITSTTFHAVIARIAVAAHLLLPYAAQQHCSTERGPHYSSMTHYGNRTHVELTTPGAPRAFVASIT
jgi:hypothetical protein